MGKSSARISHGSCLRAVTLLAVFAVLFGALPALPDVPGGRIPPLGTVPEPGTQEQELSPLEMPGLFNVFEFVGTCAECHGGTIDQQTAHFGNWAGTGMASAARDPVFRANQIIVNSEVAQRIGTAGAGNLCFRCHSPNAWYSGRTDPHFGGAADGSTMEHSIVTATDDEGVQCELCHRAIGAVTMKRPDIAQSDPAWNMLSGIDDWPHMGSPYPSGPATDNPYGNGTLQILDGLTMGGRYYGSVNIFFSDLPVPGTPYTGQTYGIYPPGWLDPLGNNVGGQPVILADNTSPLAFETPAPPPLNPDGTVNYQGQAISMEHSTFRGDFILTSDFCGACHDMTLPILNRGMPVQRTFTEWKFSALGRPGPDSRNCRDCHMPRLAHEYSDTIPFTLNPDPSLTGFFPFAKHRQGGTAFHKFAGANRDLPRMMQILYPEVDLELVGTPTGRDVRIFPGMLSSRTLAWDRALRNAEISMKEAVGVTVTQPLFNAATGRWEVRVRVTNHSGHRIPSGFPGGKRLWVALEVRDQAGNLVYQSGVYDPAAATLYTAAPDIPLNRALSPTIDSTRNAVMVYEKRTGTCSGGTCAMSASLLNDTVLFDNRIPPLGFTYVDYNSAGSRFVTYDPATLSPLHDAGRFPEGRNFDEVTYVFDAPPAAQLSSRAELYWQTHTREFMEYLKENDTSTLRPQGPPDFLNPSYPLVPTYLSDSLQRTTGASFASITDLEGVPLRDNWGGIAYAAWLLTGKGEPFLAAADDSRVAAPPSSPANIAAQSVDPFSILIDWEPVTGAEGYLLWVRYGQSDVTASWDKLALLPPGTTQFLHDGLNVSKTYGYKVQAFNGKGAGADSTAASATTATALPLFPMNLSVVGTTDSTVTLAWFDQATDETGFIIERQDVPLDRVQPLPPFREIARMATPNGAGTGMVFFTDGLSPVPTGITYAADYVPLQAGRMYNYRVIGFNAAGNSIPTVIEVQAVTLAPHILTANAGPHGVIEPSGRVSVPDGHDQSFSISPATGFHVLDVLVDGSSVGAVDAYTFANVTADHVISSSFVTSADLNLDGRTDIADAVKTLRIVVGLDQPARGVLEMADAAPLVNGRPVPDGRVDISDVLGVLRKGIGLIDW